MLGDVLRNTKCFDVKRGVIVCTCSKCSNVGEWTTGNPGTSPDHAASYFRKIGWDVNSSGRRAYCPRCQMKKAEIKKKKPTPIKDVEDFFKKAVSGDSTKNGIKVTSKVKAKAEKTKTLVGPVIETKKDEETEVRIETNNSDFRVLPDLSKLQGRDKATALIKASIVDGQYIADWDDDRIAKESNLSTYYVASIRRDLGILFERGAFKKGYAEEIEKILDEAVASGKMDDWYDDEVAKKVGCSTSYVQSLRVKRGIRFGNTTTAPKVQKAEAQKPASSSQVSHKYEDVLIDLLSDIEKSIKSLENKVTETNKKAVPSPSSVHPDPIINGLITMLPSPGSVWPMEQRKAWTTMMEYALKNIYED